MIVRLLVLFLFINFNLDLESKEAIKDKWLKNKSNIRIDKDKTKISFIEDFIYIDNSIYLCKDSSVYQLKDKFIKKVYNLSTNINKINYNNFNNQFYITLEDKVIITDKNFQVLDTILIKNGTISFSKNKIFILNSEVNKLIINKLDSNYNALKNDTINIKDYFSLSEGSFLFDENIYIVINNKVNIINTKSNNCEPLKLDSNSDINKILGIYKDYLVLLCFSSNKTISGEPIPHLRLINFKTNEQININSKNIIKGLIADVETDEGYNNIEYAIWIDKVIFKYNNINSQLLGFINTNEGIAIYTLRIKEVIE